MSAVGDLDGGRGYLNDRDGGRQRVTLDPPADIEAAHVGQVHVKHYQLGGPDPGERLVPGAHLGHRVARPPQPCGEDVTLGLVVINEEQRGWTVGHRTA